jgi:hypothetical protein
LRSLVSIVILFSLYITVESSVVCVVGWLVVVSIRWGYGIFMLIVSGLYYLSCLSFLAYLRGA